MQSLAVFFVLLSSLLGQTVTPKEAPVTIVAGESWLNHIHRRFEETSMGKTGRLGPPASATGEEMPGFQLEISPDLPSQNVTVSGSDLYRLNCQACHGESGLGAPPEINSVINPVRASSVVAVKERMKKVGMDISRSDAEKLALEAKAALLERLQDGGQDMPPFRHLSGKEIGSLTAYLKQLAGIAGAEKNQVATKESSLRIGEHIAKSTCHICHSASGTNPGARQLSDGAIPPLDTLTTRLSEHEFVRKVTRGAPIIMGDPALPHRGRMPVFYYLREDEAADVYLYLKAYPPYRWATLDSLPPQPLENRSVPETQPSEKVSVASDVGPPKIHGRRESSDQQIVAPVVAGMVVTLLLAGTLGFTVREFVKLSAENNSPAMAARNPRVEHPDANAANAKSKDRLIA
jgi:mono/diheme cytochrome c family protein